MVFPDFTGATGVDEAFVKNAGKLLSKKSKQVLGVILAIALVVFSIGAVIRSIETGKREKAEREAYLRADEFCDEVKALGSKQSIDNSYEEFESEFGYDRYARDCRNKALVQFTPKTIPKPAVKSDAQLAAEGRSCSQQWRRARSETLSGSSNDVQLRATVYACDTPGDWVLGAIDNGEYSEPLLDVICKFERRAPACN